MAVGRRLGVLVVKLYFRAGGSALRPFYGLSLRFPVANRFAGPNPQALADFFIQIRQR